MDTVLPLHSNYCIVALRLKKSQCKKEMLCKFFGTQTLFKFVVKKMSRRVTVRESLISVLP